MGEPMLLDDLAPLLPAFADRAAARPDAYPADDVDALPPRRRPRRAVPARARRARDATLVEMVRAIEAIAMVAPSTALLAAMPTGLAGVLATPADALPPEDRAAWREQVERVAAEYARGQALRGVQLGEGRRRLARRDEDRRAPPAPRARCASTARRSSPRSARHADVFFSTAKVSPPGRTPDGPSWSSSSSRRAAPGVHVAGDWNGFGMRGTESHSVRFAGAPARERSGARGSSSAVRPLQYWYCLFAAIPLGLRGLGCCAALGQPAPASPALRLRLATRSCATSRCARTCSRRPPRWRPAADAAYAGRVLRTKTYVTEQATSLYAELFALSGGRHYTRGGRISGALADAFAGTALRPPLPLALDALVAGFSLGELSGERI